jgi:cytochrome c5
MNRIIATLLALIVTMSSALAADDGATLFENQCASCHTGGVAGWWRKAPNINDKKIWAPLAAKGADVLTASTINGIGEMPPRGRCETCTDEQIRSAVEYMIEKAN